MSQGINTVKSELNHLTNDITASSRNNYKWVEETIPNKIIRILLFQNNLKIEISLAV